MARSKASDSTIPGTGLVWDHVPDGPTIPDLQDSEGPWFVDPRIIEGYLVTASDVRKMLTLTRQNHPINQEVTIRWLAEMWRDRSGQAPERDPNQLTVQLTSEQPSRRTQDWIDNLRVTTRASDLTLFTHGKCLAHAYENYHRAKHNEYRQAKEIRDNTCAMCDTYQPGQGLKCRTCELALEFEKLRRAAESEQGRKAIKKVQAASKG